MAKKRKATIERLDFGAPVPSSLDREAGTMRVVAAPFGALANRYGPRPDDGYGQWFLQLELDGADFSRFNGAPFLLDHEAVTRATIGVVESHEVTDDGLLATVRFSSRADVAPIVDDIAAGIIRGVSLGFSVLEYRASGDADGIPIFAATKWQPYELSLTPTPAFAGATVLSREIDMPDEIKTTVVPEDTSPAEVKLAKQPAKPADVRTAFYAVGLKPEDADAAIDERLSLDEVDARAIAHLAAKRAAEPAISAVQVGKSYDDPAAIRAALVDAIAARLEPGRKAEGMAGKYRGYRVGDIAAELAVAHGLTINDRLNMRSVFDQVLAIGMHTTSDFPLLLQDAANKVLEASYALQAPTYRAWAARRNFNDFKAHKFLRIGEFPSLVATKEPATITWKTIGEQREQITPAEYTAGLALTREALINDDLGALSDIANGAAGQAARDENTLAYAMLAANAVLSDGVALFSVATHANLASSASTIDVANIALAVKAMRVQTSISGQKLNLMPATLVCGPAKELVAQQLLATIQPATVANVNPYSGKLELVVDANISGNEWYLFAPTSAAAVAVWGYVGGANGPEVWVTRDEDTRGVMIRCGLDFAVGAVDFRGAFKNAGA